MSCDILRKTTSKQNFANPKNKKANSTLRASRAVPHPSTDRAFRRLTSEFGWDRVYSTKYGRWRKQTANNGLDSNFQIYGNQMWQTRYSLQKPPKTRSAASNFPFREKTRSAASNFQYYEKTRSVVPNLMALR